MSNIVDLSSSRTQNGNIYCAPASVWVPFVYKVTWPRDVAPELEGWPQYALDPSGFEGRAHIEQISRLDANSPTSVLVRRHPNRSAAGAFLSAVAIFDPSQNCTSFTQTPGGLFTISQIPTYAPWPSPLLIYDISYRTNDIFGFGVWVTGVTTDGVEIHGDDVFFPGSPSLVHQPNGDILLADPAPNELTAPFASPR